MPKRAIGIPRQPVRIAARERPLRVACPRAGRLAVAVPAFIAGLWLWLYLLPEDAFLEPLEYALGLMLLGTGAAAIGWALMPRAVLTADRGDLVVRYGLAFFERLVARLPLDLLDVRVVSEPVHAVRHGGEDFLKAVAGAVLPFRRRPDGAREVALYVLQVRTRGQEQWLSVVGSQVASDVENALLAVRRAAETSPSAEPEVTVNE